MDVKGTIGFEDFVKLDLRVGLVEEVEEVVESDKLLKMNVRFGEDEVKTVFAGVKKWFGPADLQGQKLGFVYNMEPRKMFGDESQAMMLAISLEDGSCVLWPVPEGVPVGSVIR